MRIIKRLVVTNLLVTAVVASLVGAGTAYAYLTSVGAGTGTASTGTLQTVSLLAVTGTPTSSLQPGSTGDVLLSINNPNGFPVSLVSVVGNGSISVSGGSGCTAANAGVTFTNQTALSVSIPKNNNAFAVDLSGAAAMAYSSASACQGATFLIPVTITVQT